MTTLIINEMLSLQSIDKCHIEELSLIIFRNRSMLAIKFEWGKEYSQKSTLDEIVTIISSKINPWKRDTHRRTFVVIYDHHVIGMMDYKYIDDRIVLGAWLDERMHNRGLATQCFQKLVQYLHFNEQNHVLTIQIKESNHPMVSIAKKLNFIPCSMSDPSWMCWEKIAT